MGTGADSVSLYKHIPHPWHAQRRVAGPVKVADQLKREGWYSRINARIAMWVTMAVGSMTCAWLFAALAFAGLPTALKPGNIGFLFWFSSDLLQLTLLSVIIVGQNIQAQAADKRAQATFNDGEATMHAVDGVAAHMSKQDEVLTAIAGRLGISISADTAPRSESSQP